MAEKEPWEMTASEYATSMRNLEDRYEAILIKLAKGEDIDPNSPVGREHQQNAFQQLKRETGFTGGFTDMAGWGHKAKVRLALSEGKPVPAEVLLDYPDLIKAAPKVPVARGIQSGRTAGFGEISQFINRPQAEGFRINIAEATKGGKWVLLGSIPAELVEIGTSHSISFSSREEAVRAAKKLGYEEGKIYSKETGKEIPTVDRIKKFKEDVEECERKRGIKL